MNSWGWGCSEEVKDERMRGWVQIRDFEPLGDRTLGVRGREVCSSDMVATHSDLR